MGRKTYHSAAHGTGRISGIRNQSANGLKSVRDSVMLRARLGIGQGFKP
ncbi:MAG: hypothetical protein OXF66_04660 [Gammaproteobacteria bacterium]|nr:hypothetical protein [Gammaproteobacteria bacterium]